MDFIERLLSISPDGGSGAWEFALFAIPIFGIASSPRPDGREARPERGDRYDVRGTEAVQDGGPCSRREVDTYPFVVPTQ